MASTTTTVHAARSELRLIVVHRCWEGREVVRSSSCSLSLLARMDKDPPWMTRELRGTHSVAGTQKL